MAVQPFEFFRRRFLGGDVEENAAHGGSLTLFGHDRAAFADPNHPVIGGDHPVFASVRPAEAGVFLTQQEGFGLVLRMHAIQPETGVGNPFLRRIAEDADALLADEGKTEGVRIAGPDDAVNGIDERLHPLLREADGGVLLLDAAQHFVEGFRELTEFVAAVADFRAQGIVFSVADDFSGPGQAQHRIRDDALEPAGKENRQTDGQDRDVKNHEAVKPQQVQKGAVEIGAQVKRAHLFVIQINRLREQQVAARETRLVRRRELPQRADVLGPAEPRERGAVGRGQGG